jgi:hypothetical protein
MRSTSIEKIKYFSDWFERKRSLKSPAKGDRGARIVHWPVEARELVERIPPRPYTGDGVGPAYRRDDDGERETSAQDSPGKSNGRSHARSGDEFTLVDLADKPLWVGWKIGVRQKGDKETKIPFDPKSGRWAKSDDAATWGTRQQAQEWARKSAGDVGIELADIGGGLHLAGIDLDTCRDPQTGVIEEWALAVIRRFSSYTEVSPSGTGLKVFFVYRIEDKAELDALFGGETNLGRQFKKSAKGDHPPAIEAYRAKRYFAVTGQQFETYANLRTIPFEDWRWLLQEAGPAFTGKKARAERTQRPRAADAAHDDSRSGKAFREGARLKREGATYEQMVDALQNSDDPDIANWVNEKGLPNDERELKRIYEKAEAACDDYANDQEIRARLDELIVERQKFAKDSREYKDIKDEAIRLLSAMSLDYRGNAEFLRHFRQDWGITSDALNKLLREHDAKRRESRRDTGEASLHVSENGALYPNLHNARQLMLQDEQMRGAFRFNQMTLEIDVMRSVPGETARGCYPHKLTDVDIADAMIWLQKRQLFMVTENTTRQAVHSVANDQPYHPVREYLASLKWDGEPRIDTWLIDYGGAKDNLYVRQIGAMFLIQMVARVMQPGCKADYILFLVGPQGALKSTTAQKLGRDWFSDDLPDIRDKRKASLHLCGLWVAELPELSSMSRADVEDWKAFAARKVDKYQKPYAHYETTQPRQCVFIGTTNDPAPLKDKTGNRRDWIVEVKRFDMERLNANVDQLFAEAYARYGKGEHWWPDETVEVEHFAPEQESFVAEENWEILLTELLQQEFRNIPHMGIKTKDMTQYMQDKFPRVSPKAWKAHLAKLGWEYKSKRPMIGDKRYDPIWVWSRKETKHIEALQKWNGGGFGEGPAHWRKTLPDDDAM